MKNKHIILLSVGAILAAGLASCGGTGAKIAAPTLKYEGMTPCAEPISDPYITVPYNLPNFNFSWGAVDGATTYSFYVHAPAVEAKGSEAAVPEKYTLLTETTDTSYSFVYDRTTTSAHNLPCTYASPAGTYSNEYVVTAGYYKDGKKVESTYSNVEKVSITNPGQADSTAVAKSTTFPLDVVKANQWFPEQGFDFDAQYGWEPAVRQTAEDGTVTVTPVFTSANFEEQHYACKMAEDDPATEKVDESKTIASYPTCVVALPDEKTAGQGLAAAIACYHNGLNFLAIDGEKVSTSSYWKLGTYLYKTSSKTDYTLYGRVDIKIFDVAGFIANPDNKATSVFGYTTGVVIEFTGAAA